MEDLTAHAVYEFSLLHFILRLFSFSLSIELQYVLLWLNQYHCISGKLVMYCGKYVGALLLCVPTEWTGYFIFLSVISYNAMKHFLVTVINQESALAIFRKKKTKLKNMLCFKYTDLVCDGNKARAKSVLRLFTVFQVCDAFLFLFSIL